MFKSLMLGLAASAAATGALAPVAADAQRYGGPYGWDGGYRYERADRDNYGAGWHGPRGSYDRGYYDRGYADRSYDDRGYGRPRRCSNGTTGAVIGAVAGGLLGRAIDVRGDHALGTVLGAGGGLLAGRAVERAGNPGWCR